VSKRGTEAKRFQCMDAYRKAKEGPWLQQLCISLGKRDFWWLPLVVCKLVGNLQVTGLSWLEPCFIHQPHTSNVFEKDMFCSVPPWGV
jgi:hypothetical protein